MDAGWSRILGRNEDDGFGYALALSNDGKRFIAGAGGPITFADFETPPISGGYAHMYEFVHYDAKAAAVNASTTTAAGEWVQVGNYYFATSSHTESGDQPSETHGYSLSMSANGSRVAVLHKYGGEPSEPGCYIMVYEQR